MILFTEIIYRDVMEMGEKIPREKETKEKFSFGFFPPPLLRYRGRLFSGVRER